MKWLAKFLLLIFGLSVAGYVLLDFGHELLHKTKLHTHQIAEHHHIEDHQQLFTPDSQQQSQKIAVEISYFFFYFQKPIEYTLAQALEADSKGCLFNKFIDISIPPATPPPLAARIVSFF
jgi:hypothetical protein